MPKENAPFGARNARSAALHEDSDRSDRAGRDTPLASLRGLDYGSQLEALRPDALPIMRQASGRASVDADAAFAAATRGPGGAVPYRAEMEGAFGERFDGVAAHTGQGAAMEGIGARAAARGEEVVFADAQPTREVVAHELTHVVQARGGGLEGVHGDSGLSTPADAAEVEADRVAADVAAGREAEVTTQTSGRGIQRLVDERKLDKLHIHGDEQARLVRLVTAYNELAERETVGDARQRARVSRRLLVRLEEIEEGVDEYQTHALQVPGSKETEGMNELALDVRAEQDAIAAILDDEAWDQAGDRTWARAIDMTKLGVTPMPMTLGELDESVTTIRETKVGKGESENRKEQGSVFRRNKARGEAEKEDSPVAEAVASAGWPTDPQVAKHQLSKRFPKGPPLQQEEYRAIRTLSDLGKKGVRWLECAGMFTSQEARAYLDAGNFRDFHQLHRVQKLQLASTAWRHNYPETIPPFQVELSMRGRQSEGEEKDEMKERIDEGTQEQWISTLGGTMNEEAYHATERGNVRSGTDKKKKLTPRQVAKKNAHANEVLEKVFVLLQAGLQQAGDDGSYIDWQGPVSKALSHGGRVNVRVPKLNSKGDNKYALLDWLGVTHDGGELDEEGGVFTRGFGTHRVAIGEDKEDGEKGTFKELGGKGASLKNKLSGDTKLFGMNLAIGGLGERDFNGDVILPDGAHGHLFIGFRHPTVKKDGALQLGLETTGPHAPSTVGYVHDWNSTEKTANPISSVGGLKSDKVGGIDAPPLVELEKIQQEAEGQGLGSWVELLDHIKHTFDQLGQEKARALTGARGLL